MYNFLWSNNSSSMISQANSILYVTLYYCLMMMKSNVMYESYKVRFYRTKKQSNSWEEWEATWNYMSKCSLDTLIFICLYANTFVNFPFIYTQRTSVSLGWFEPMNCTSRKTTILNHIRILTRIGPYSSRITLQTCVFTKI